MRLVSLALVTLLLPHAAAAQVQRPMPVVQRLEPTSGPTGAEVTLHGRHFDNSQTVWLGERECEITSRFPNRWTVRVPSGATSGTLEVRTARGRVEGPRFRVTGAAPAPVISGFAPTSGAAGTEVVISGEHFSPRLTENQVLLGERPVVVRSATPTTLNVILPSGAESAPFTVRVTGAGEARSEAPFTIGTGTTIASFEPAIGPVRTRVTIRGTGFHRSRARVRVYLGERAARVLRASPTELTVEVPRDAASGLWLVDVRGGGRVHSASPFVVRAPPSISAMEPAFGAPGTRVTLRGAHFGTDIRQVVARLGELTLPLRDIADDRLVFEIPAGAASGPVEVTVGELGPARTRGELRITAGVTLSSFAPHSGPVGTEVTITGSGFSSDRAHDTVTMGGVAAEVVRASDTELVVRVPEASSGPLTIAVANAGEVRTAQPFVITTPPIIDGFAPASGPPGTEITIRGRNFGARRGLVRVLVGGVNAPVRTVSDTQVTATVPPTGASGPLRVIVRLHGAGTSTSAFTVTGGD